MIRRNGIRSRRHPNKNCQLVGLADHPPPSQDHICQWFTSNSSVLKTRDLMSIWGFFSKISAIRNLFSFTIMPWPKLNRHLEHKSDLSWASVFIDVQYHTSRIHYHILQVVLVSPLFLMLISSHSHQPVRSCSFILFDRIWFFSSLIL